MLFLFVVYLCLLLLPNKTEHVFLYVDKTLAIKVFTYAIVLIAVGLTMEKKNLILLLNMNW